MKNRFFKGRELKTVAESSSALNWYRYQVVSANGQLSRGQRQAASSAQLEESLKAEGLTLLEAHLRRPGLWQQWQVLRAVRLSTRQLVLVLRQLALLVASRIPLERALAVIQSQESQGAARQLWHNVREQLRQGRSFEQALSAYPRIFSPLMLTLIKVGESTGKLDQVLDKLVIYLERRAALSEKLRSALAYPLLMVVMAVVVVTGMFRYVLPQVADIFSRNQQDLPLSTRSLLALSQYVADYGAWLLAALMALVLLLWLLRQRPKMQMFWHRLWLNWPLLGRLMQASEVARLAHMLALLVGSGVPLLEALKLCRQGLTLVPMQAAVLRLEQAVTEGQTLSQALALEPVFPPMLRHLISSGEESGRLGLMLQAAAEEQERMLTYRSALLLSFLEPLLIVFLGLMVLFLVVSVMVPILQMNQMVR